MPLLRRPGIFSKKPILLGGNSPSARTALKANRLKRASSEINKTTLNSFATSSPIRVSNNTSSKYGIRN